MPNGGTMGTGDYLKDYKTQIANWYVAGEVPCELIINILRYGWEALPSRFDEDSIEGEIYRYVRSTLPSDAWGSPEKVMLWAEMKQGGLL